MTDAIAAVSTSSVSPSPISPLLVAIVTGAAGGIGRWIAAGLAAANYRVVIVGRNAERLKATADWLRAKVPGAVIDQRIADLSSMKETFALGHELIETYPRISVLITNAGIFSAQREETSEGHETVLAVNHLSPFLLTQTLLPSLEASDHARIITIGSDMSDRAEIEAGNLELRYDWNLVRAYRRSKLAQMMVMFELADRLKGTKVTANVAHPGAVASGLIRVPGIIGLTWKLMAPFLLSEEAGADTPLHVALSKSVDGMTGCYFKNKKAVSPNPRALDTGLCQQVWRATEECLSSAMQDAGY